MAKLKKLVKNDELVEFMREFTSEDGLSQARVERATSWTDRALGELDERLEEHQWLAGDAFSLAAYCARASSDRSGFHPRGLSQLYIRSSSAGSHGRSGGSGKMLIDIVDDVAGFGDHDAIVNQYRHEPLRVDCDELVSSWYLQN